MSGVLKLPSSAVALCGASSLLAQVTVSPTFTVTEAGENAKLTIVTLSEADFRAVGAEAADATAAGAAAETPPEAAEPSSEGLDGVRRVEPADAPAGGASE